MSDTKTLTFSNSNGEVVHSAYTVKPGNIATLDGNIGKNTFRNDSTLEWALLSSNVKTIAESAFESCRELQVVEYGELKDQMQASEQNSTTSKAGAQPQENSQEKKIIEPISLTGTVTVHCRAFKDCQKLHTVVFPKCDGVTIEKEAFAGCTSLRTVVFWSENGNLSVTIDADAFIGCGIDRLVFVTNLADENGSVARFAREHGYQLVVANDIK